VRLCRISNELGSTVLGLYHDKYVIPINTLHYVYNNTGYSALPLIPCPGDNPLPFLPPHWSNLRHLQWLDNVAEVIEARGAETQESISISIEEALIDIPVPMPNKLLCLAGNYAEHVAESGGKPLGKTDTFPFFFMKPPTTTVRPSGSVVALPETSPDNIDWEVELTVVIGAHAKNIEPEDARHVIAGYTIGLDISNRRLRLNPNRVEQPNTGFFEWLNGKWHDGFAPIGPCIRVADDAFDPTSADISLSVNGQKMQDSNTSNMVFNVYELVSYASKIMTLEPGDLMMTGTPSGVGASREIYLRSGDHLEATIQGIGTLEAFIL